MANNGPLQPKIKEVAQQWAEFLYAEFQRDKQLRQRANGMKIIKPTYHDKLNP